MTELVNEYSLVSDA